MTIHEELFIYKKLSEEKLTLLIKAATEEFADKGLLSANLNTIAKKAEISVGVIYKYYKDKDSLFLACVHSSLTTLSDLLKQVIIKEDNLEECIRQVVKTLIAHSATESSVVRMYNLITSNEANRFAAELAKEIEGVSSSVYKELFLKAQLQGNLKKNADAIMFAFFFDSLLMTVQFSYCCNYYKERLKLYCGDNIFSDNEKMENELVKFLLSALKGE